jgi:DNA (cytosine-5)-methyltransferase 1
VAQQCSMNFIDLFCGIGAFSYTLSTMGHKCVGACDNNAKVIEAYLKNFPSHGIVSCEDVRDFIPKTSPHDILCAGFPCQPFSKSGKQLGFADKMRGNLVYSVIQIAEMHLPEYIILENVANLAKHNSGITWLFIKEELHRLGYSVRSTQHVSSGGSGMLSPHNYGFPQKRERFFAICRRGYLPSDPFPPETGVVDKSLENILIDITLLSQQDQAFSLLSAHQTQAVALWQQFIDWLPKKGDDLPSFPLWAEEFGATYPFQFGTPYSALLRDEITFSSSTDAFNTSLEEALVNLPPYARDKRLMFPRWKRRFLQQNRDWYDNHRQYIPDTWLDALRKLPHTYRKLEWNVKGGSSSILDHCIQFRPSGVRVSCVDYVPSVVSMNATQLPVYGPQNRRLTLREVKRCFGFPDDFVLPSPNTEAVKALGNTIHTGLLKLMFRRLFSFPELPNHVTHSSFGSQLNLLDNRAIVAKQA